MRIDGQRTRAKLVDTAEQLFAEQGIGNVTLLAVSKAAGQSNRNAAADDFGNKRGLLEAVLRKHSAGINEERLRRLEELERKATLELADLMGAIVSPLADKLAEGMSGVAYLRINGQLMESPDFSSLRRESASICATTPVCTGCSANSSPIRLRRCASRAASWWKS